MSKIKILFALFVVLNTMAGSASPNAQEPGMAQKFYEANKNYDIAYGLLRKEKPVEATIYYEKAIKLLPNHASYWKEYIAALLRSNHLQKAAMAGWRCIELKPRDAGCWGNLGSVFMHAREWDALNWFYKGLIGKDFAKPHIENYFTNLGFYAWQEGDYDVAETALKYVLSKNPNNYKALIDYGALQLSQGKTSEAITKIKTVLNNSIDPELKKFGSQLLRDIKNNKPQQNNRVLESYQKLPSRFLKQPDFNKALALQIDENVEKVYNIFMNNKLSLVVPEHWEEGFEPAKKEGKSRIYFYNKDKSGNGPSYFYMLIDVLVPEPWYKITDKLIKDTLSKTRDKILESSSAKQIVLKPLKSSNIRGLYFYSALSPEPDDIENDKKMTHSFASVVDAGGYFVLVHANFTDHQKIREEILNVVKSMNAFY